MSEQPRFRPLYRQISELLTARLATGHWRPGEPLPSETDLAREYGVSQGTLRKAVDDLVARRLLVRRQGRGTFVARHDHQRSLFQFFHLHDDQQGERQLPTTRVLASQTVRASAAERHYLGLDARSRVLRIRRLRYLAGEPVIHESLSVSVARFPGLVTLPTAQLPDTLYELYERSYGVTIAHASEQLRAVAADAADAAVLNITLGMPLLEIHRVARDIENQPVEWRVSRCDTRHHHYLNELD